MNKTLFIVSLLAASSVMAETAATKIDPTRQNELLYFIKHDCGSCHGMTLKGGLGPALLPKTLAAKPKEFLVTTILEGRKNTAMPPWKSMLSKADAIWITEQLQNGGIQQTELAQNKAPLNKDNRDKTSKDKAVKDKQQ